MARYIDADELIAEITSLKISLSGEDIFIDRAKESVLRVIDEQPTADVEEVKHGEWQEEYYGSDNIVCSSCGHMWNILDNDTHTFNHCPNCGAKMDGGKEDDR